MHHSAAILETDDIGHGFFGSAGGVSTGVYSSLNCGPGSNDQPDAVIENRRRAVRQIGRDPHPLATLDQVHGADVITVTTAWADYYSNRPKGDAMVTRNRNLALGILTADCCPVLFADPENGVIGAAHAGWRGALAGVVPNTLKAMQQIGAKLSNIRAAIGPTIQQSSYEVGTEVQTAFIAASPGNERFFIPHKNLSSPGLSGAKSPGIHGSESLDFQLSAQDAVSVDPRAPLAAAPRMTMEKYWFDLPGYVADSLRQAGVTLYENLGRDTYPAANGFFSYRRRTHEAQKSGETAADYGRQISTIILR